MTHETRLVAIPSPFERGFLRAIDLWRSGLTWELITHKAASSDAYDRGMVASVEAMSGWLDVARREAKAFGENEATIERLIAAARAA